jgi:hypothetical protein
MKPRQYSTWGRAYAACKRIGHAIVAVVPDGKGRRVALLQPVHGTVRCVPYSQVPADYVPLAER